jgi:hypothetical protein
MGRFWCWTGKNDAGDMVLGECVEELDAKSAAASYMYKLREDNGDIEEAEYEVVWVHGVNEWNDGITRKFKVIYDEESDTYWAEELTNG